MKKNILFVCTHNAARSQMAEGLLNASYADLYVAQSAGTDPRGVSPYAIKAMAEIGIDICGHRSKSIDEFRNTVFDEVITVCDAANESCPYFPGGKKRRHQSFADPSVLTGTSEEILDGFRRIRDEIRAWLGKDFGNR